MEKRTYAGIRNDKERSKKKILDAVGVIVRNEGYSNINILKVSKISGLSRRLINRYFESVEQLIETYIKSKDYWVAPAGNTGEVMENNKNLDTRSILETLLVNQLDYVSKEEEMQKILLYQISQRSKIMFEVAEEREKLGAEFFKMSDPFFENTDIDLRAITGLLVGGIYYMVLHAKTNDSLFCQIDVNSIEGMNRIKKAVHEILFDTYKRAEKHKTKKGKHSV